MSIAGACLAAGLASLSSAAMAQQVEWQRFGRTSNGRFGACMVWVPDLDRDGVDELAVSSPDNGIVEIVSGATFETLRRIVAEDDEQFGETLALAGDLDGDGMVDLWIGSPRFDHDRGRVRAFSIASRATLREVVGSAKKSGFGSALAVVSDLDGDGCGELVIGAPSELQLSVTRPRGSISSFSSRDGSLLAKEPNPGWSGYATNLATIHDVDRDGRLDLAMAGLGSTPGTFRGPERRAVMTLSGSNCRAIGEHALERQGWAYRYRCISVSDVDGDGVRELLVCAPGDSSGSSAWLVAGANFHVLLHWRGDFQDDCGEAGDFDLDGIPDFIFDVRAADTFGLATGRVFSGRDGSNLAVFGSPESYYTLGGQLRFPGGGVRDLDRDGRDDVVAAYPTLDGWIGAWSPTRPGRLLEQWGEHRSSRPIAAGAIGDVDGDGIDDAAVLEGQWAVEEDYDADAITLRSGRDGRVIARTAWRAPFSLTGHRVGSAPDLDGDGVDDFWTAGAGAVRLFSGRDATLLRELTGSSADGFGLAAAVAHDPASGSNVVAVALPSAKITLALTGAVELHDAGSGALLWRTTATLGHNKLGRSLVAIGDVDGDGHVDFAVGAYDNTKTWSRFWSVDLLSGADGSCLSTIRDTAELQSQFGASVATIADRDGDGLDELLIGAPVGGDDQLGVVHVVESASWSTAQVIGSNGLARAFGTTVAAAPDVNGDGITDLLVGEGSPGTVFLHSGADGALIAELSDEEDGVTWSRHVSVVPSWRANAGDVARPALLVQDDRWNRGQNGYGCVQLLSLEELFLQVEPRVAAAGSSVEGWVRGGPAGADVGVYLVEVNGVPFDEFLDFHVLDATGSLHTSEVVPPGLAGTVERVRAYAVGFDGRLVQSRDWEIRFE
ncbi:MAG: FG-GAP repeat protein [Planctomycetes bacterium]|nr:FG-GAP repeat protein [Planctomycetota bacterium]